MQNGTPFFQESRVRLKCIFNNLHPRQVPCLVMRPSHSAAAQTKQANKAPRVDDQDRKLKLVEATIKTASCSTPGPRICSHCTTTNLPRNTQLTSHVPARPIDTGIVLLGDVIIARETTKAPLPPSSTSQASVLGPCRSTGVQYNLIAIPCRKTVSIGTLALVFVTL